MKLKIHRGTGAVSYNLVEISTGKAKIILDCGRDLPLMDCNSYETAIDIPGLTSGKSTYDAVFVTHYYTDHTDLIERINGDIPVYMNADTKTILDIAADFTDSPLPRVSKYLEHGCSEQVGDISVVPLSVNYRFMGRMILLIEASGRKLLYTSGFRSIDPAYNAILGKIDILLCETFIIGDKDDTDIYDVETFAAGIMRNTDKPVFVLCSATDADRIKHIERACRKSGRNMALDPFMKAVLEKLTTPLIIDPFGFIPYIDTERTPRIQKHLISNRDMDFNGIQNFSSAEIVARMTNLTFMVRPSMGDFLTQFDKMTPLAGSTLICFMWSGYENTAPIKEFLEVCRSLGMNGTFIRASDYAYRKQLKNTVSQLEPKILISVQTEGIEIFRDMHDNVITLDEGEVTL